MKKTLLYIIGAIGIIIVIGGIFGFVMIIIGRQRAGLPIGEKTFSTYDTARSYRLSEDGTVLSDPASSRIDLKINGSDQPLPTKVPFSFTLAWKIDSEIDLSDCKMMGPNIREGYLGTDWPGVLKSHEGSLRFENVILGESTAEQHKSAPLYHGVASFYYHVTGSGYDNTIVVECNTSAGLETKNVVIRIDR